MIRPGSDCVSETTLQPPAVRGPSTFEGLAKPGRYGAPSGSAGVTAAERQGLGIASIAVRKGQDAGLAAAIRQRYGVDPPSSPKRVAKGEVALVGAGPGRWLAIKENDAGSEFAASLRTALAGLASVSDQSDGRGVLRLSGPRLMDTLAKLCGLDLHPRSFTQGDAALTVMAHIDVQLWKLDEAPVFEISVSRSFAGSLWHELEEAAAEYGFAVEPVRQG
jgi:sarcosine oxidase subunit gamma